MLSWLSLGFSESDRMSDDEAKGFYFALMSKSDGTDCFHSMGLIYNVVLYQSTNSVFSKYDPKC